MNNNQFDWIPFYQRSAERKQLLLTEDRLMKRLFSVLFLLAVFLCTTVVVADGNPYPYWQDTQHGTQYYRTITCTYYAWREVYNRFGISMPNWGNAKSWYSAAEANPNYSTGTTPAVNSIVCWGSDDPKGWGHVAFVTAVNSNGTITVCEGGIWDKGETGRTNGLYYSAIGSSNGKGPLLGYIYFNDSTPPQITSARIHHITDSGYYAFVEATDNTAVAELQIGTWHSNMSIDDAHWQVLKNPVDGIASFYIEYDSYPDAEGATFYTNAYALDAVGNPSSAVRCVPVIDLGDDFYATVTHASGGQWEVSGSKVTIGEVTETDNPKSVDPKRVWHFIRQQDGRYAESYEISSAWNDKCLDIENYGTASGTPVNLLDRATNSAQRFYMYQLGDKYYFNSVYCLNALDVSGAYESTGGTLQTWTNNQTAAQLFGIHILPNYPDIEEPDELILPEDLEIIEEQAFYASAAESVTIPRSVRFIGSKAFGNCPDLVYVRIYAETEDISPDAFDECGSGLTIYCEEHSAAHIRAQEKGIHFVLISGDE